MSADRVCVEVCYPISKNSVAYLIDSMVPKPIEGEDTYHGVPASRGGQTKHIIFSTQVKLNHYGAFSLRRKGLPNYGHGLAGRLLVWAHVYYHGLVFLEVHGQFKV